MSKRRNRQTPIKSITVAPTGGLDLSRPAGAIQDTSLSVAYNVWYDPAAGLVTRYGLADAGLAALTAPIDNLVVFSRIDQAEYIVAASGGAFWQADFTAGTWVQIGTETYDATITPHFTVFNQTLLAACGAASLWFWDGTASGWVTGSPSNARVIAAIAGRVVCDGSLTDTGGTAAWLDYVHFSGIRDYTEWDYDQTTISIAAGFGDGARINGLAVIYDILLISKVIANADGQVIGKRMFGINTSGASDAWQGVAMSNVNAALSGDAIVGLAGQAMLLDEDGVQLWAPSPGGAYGDIAIDPVLGPRVNGLLTYLARNDAARAMLWPCRTLGQVWCLVRVDDSYRLAVYHPMGGQWTELDFPGSVPTCFCEAGDQMYLADTAGRLFVLQDKGTDTDSGGVEQPISSAVRSKRFEGVNDLILKTVRLDIKALREGRVKVEAVEGDGTTNIFLGYVDFGELSADQRLYDANDPLSEADYPLLSDPGQIRTMQNDFRPNGPRSRGIYIQIKGEGGRFCLTSILLSVAQAG